jgi:hypothetical protein
MDGSDSGGCYDSGSSSSSSDYGGSCSSNDFSSGVPEPVASTTSHQETGWDLVSVQAAFDMGMDQASSDDARRREPRRDVPREPRDREVVRIETLRVPIPQQHPIPHIRKSYRALEKALELSLKKPSKARMLAHAAYDLTQDGGVDEDVRQAILNFLRAMAGDPIRPWWPK